MGRESVHWLGVIICALIQLAVFWSGVGLALVPNDEYFEFQWAARNTGQELKTPLKTAPAGRPDADMDLPEAWDITIGRTARERYTPVIAVVDTGINRVHPELENNLWAPRISQTIASKNPVLIPDLSVPPLNSGFGFNRSAIRPLDDHGTQVAAVLGAIGNNQVGLAGVSWTSKIFSINHVNLGATWRDVFDAAVFPRPKPRIVNISAGIGLEDKTDLIRVVNANPDVLFVLSAGNSTENLDAESKADHQCRFHAPNMICVAGTDQFDNLSPGSNFGENYVDVGAPGTNIVLPSLVSNITRGLRSFSREEDTHLLGVGWRYGSNDLPVGGADGSYLTDPAPLNLSGSTRCGITLVANDGTPRLESSTDGGTTWIPTKLHPRKTDGPPEYSGVVPSSPNVLLRITSLTPGTNTSPAYEHIECEPAFHDITSEKSVAFTEATTGQFDELGWTSAKGWVTTARPGALLTVRERFQLQHKKKCTLTPKALDSSEARAHLTVELSTGGDWNPLTPSTSPGPWSYDLPSMKGVRIRYRVQKSAPSIPIRLAGQSITCIAAGNSINNFTFGDGTSFAAPQVAGIAALLLSVKPSLEPTEVKRLIVENGERRLSLIGKTVSGRRVNAKRALQAAMGREVSPERHYPTRPFQTWTLQPGMRSESPNPSFWIYPVRFSPVKGALRTISRGDLEDARLSVRLAPRSSDTSLTLTLSSILPGDVESPLDEITVKDVPSGIHNGRLTQFFPHFPTSGTTHYRLTVRLQSPETAPKVKAVDFTVTG